MNKLFQYGSSEKNSSFHDRFAYTPKPGIEKTSLSTFPASNPKPNHTSGQEKSGSFSNFIGIERNHPPVLKHDMVCNPRMPYDSDFDEYLDHMIDEEAELYSEENFLEGDGVDVSYNAFSPLDTECNSAKQPGNSKNVEFTRNTGFGMGTKQVITSQKTKKTNNENGKEIDVKDFQSKVVQMKLPFAGRKRFIDETFETGEEANSSTVSSINNSSTPNTGINKTSDVVELDGFKVPAVPLNKHSKHISKSVRSLQLEENSISGLHVHHSHSSSNYMLSNLLSQQECSIVGRHTGDLTNSVARNRSSHQQLLDRCASKYSTSHLQGEVKRKVQSVTQPPVAIESPLHTKALHPLPRPAQCTFFTAGPDDRYWNF